jgi:hypothetical protein
LTHLETLLIYTGMLFLGMLVLAMATLVLAMGIYQSRKAPPRG